MTTPNKIAEVCDSIKDMLIEKNTAYGNSVGDPVRIFSKADKLEAIRVRIDDKLSRIQRGTGYPGDDDVRDLAGYLLLYLANDGSTDAPGSGASAEVLIDKDGDVWKRQPNGKYQCDTLPHMGTVSYSYLTDFYAPLRAV